MHAMADEPDPDRLRALEARLANVKEKVAPKPSTGTGKGFSQGEIAWRMVIELVTGMVIGMGIGYGVDWLFGTLPLFLVIFALLGFAAGIKTMLRTAEQMNKAAAGQPGADRKEDRRGD
jgi:ATP synthase protein I